MARFEKIEEATKARTTKARALRPVSPEGREAALRKGWAAVGDETARNPVDDLWHWWWRNNGTEETLAEMLDAAGKGWNGPYDARGFLARWIQARQERIENIKNRAEDQHRRDLAGQR
jgi:hypothetical protein